MRMFALRNLATSPTRRGVTLIELLIVVGIILLISSVGLTIFTPSLPKRQLREASRGLTAMLQGARDRALRLKRRVGVQIERLRQVGDPTNLAGDITLNPSIGARVSFIEEPPPYCGDTIGSKMTIRFTGAYVLNGDYTAYQRVNITGLSSTDVGWIGQFREGTRIEFGTQGHQFVLSAPASGADDTGAYAVAPSAMNPWPAVSLHYKLPDTTTLTNSFSIIRDPVVLPGGAIEFPEQVAIDLEASGFAYGANDGDEFGGRADSGDSPRYLTDLPVQILFGPDGMLARVRYGGWNAGVGVAGGQAKLTKRSPSEAVLKFKTPTSPICLMLGKVEQISLMDVGERQIHTWQDPDSLWVTIDPSTGRIKSTENNAFVDSGGVSVPITDGTVTAAQKATQLLNARKYALDVQALGGR